jgi:putative ribosome biogenesis GTPase RsgA
MSRSWFLVFVMSALPIIGCDTLKLQREYTIQPEPKTVVVTKVVPTETDAERLLVYFGEVRAMSAREVAAAVLDARVASAKEQGELPRLQLATLLAFARESDEAEALVLIEASMLTDQPESRARRAYAHLLYQHITERRRSRDLLAQVQGRTREGTLAVQAAKAEARALQDRVDALRQQLDALTDIEKSLATGRKTSAVP